MSVRVSYACVLSQLCLSVVPNTLLGSSLEPLTFAFSPRLRLLYLAEVIGSASFGEGSVPGDPGTARESRVRALSALER